MYLNLQLINSGVTGTTDFVFTMRTTGANEEIIIPLEGTNDCMIDWGDGNTETVTTPSPTHEYATADDYEVVIWGSVSTIAFDGWQSAPNLIKVSNLGVVGWESFSFGFSDCANLEYFNSGNTDTSSVVNMVSMFGFLPASAQVIIDTLDTSNVLKLDYMFAGSNFEIPPDISHFNTSKVEDMQQFFAQCTSMVTPPDLSGFDTSNVTNMGYMFDGWNACQTPPDLSSFDTSKVTIIVDMMKGWTSMGAVDIPIDTWNIEEVAYAANFLQDSTLTTACYDRTLIAWAAQTVKPNVTAHFGNSKYSLAGLAARETLTSAPNNWTITDGGYDSTPADDEFKFTMRTTGAAETITLPATGTNNFAIDWGDGNTETVTTASPTHEYATADDYQIRIVGTCPEWSFNNSAEADKLISVSNLGDVGWNELAYSFYGCGNLESFTVGTTDTSAVVSMRNMMRSCTAMTNAPVLANLDSSNVTDMNSMMSDWTVMTSPPDLSVLDTSKVENMYGIMSGWALMTTPPDITNWDTSKVTNMHNMMYNWAVMTTPPDLSNLNTENVTSMRSMMWNWPDMLTPPDVSNFNTSKVVDMVSMMQYWTSMGEIDIDMDLWNIEACTAMSNMLSGTTLTTECYDRVLIAWAAQTVQPNVTAHFGNSKYTAGGAAEAARDVLTGAPNNWTITDGGTA